MRKVLVFNQVSADGYFSDPNGDMSWAHRKDPEWDAFVDGNASGGGLLVFGRITYQMMESFWPTPQAARSAPVVAAEMNNLEKVVFSTTLDKVSWNNTRLVKGGVEAEVRKLKTQPGKDIVIMGSGTIVSQLAQEGLIDEYQLIVIRSFWAKGRRCSTASNAS